MRRLLPVWMLLALACGDATGPGAVDAVRTVLFYREDTGRNFLLNSDGTAERVIALPDSGLVPVGAAVNGSEVAFLGGNALILINLNDPARRDTLLHPIPAAMSPVAFSPNGRRVAFFAYGADPRLLVIDRDGATDTLAAGNHVPDLPPAFSPDGEKVALITVTPISVILTVVSLGPDPVQAEAAGFSRFTYQPVFGWPRWTDEGVLLATVRVGDGVDTLSVVAINPETPSQFSGVAFGLVSPILNYDAGSSYAFSTDGLALVVAAMPTITDRRRLYYGTRGGRLTSLLEDPAARPAFPLVLSP